MALHRRHTPSPRFVLDFHEPTRPWSECSECSSVGLLALTYPTRPTHSGGVCSCFGARLHLLHHLYFLQELQADLERQRRILHNAAILQARDQEERAHVSAVSAPSVTENPPPPTTENFPTGQRDDNMHSVGAPEQTAYSSQGPRQTSRPSELPPMGKDRDWQPEAWTPQTARRRGG